MSAAIDFAAAETFLRQAREAQEAGDETRCHAACRLVALALGVTGIVPPKFRTEHLA